MEKRLVALEHKTAKGRVEINGLSPLDAISTWPGAIGYMPQDVLISNGTVRENVMLGFDSNPMYDQRVQSAITIAQLYSLLFE